MEAPKKVIVIKFGPSNYDRNAPGVWPSDYIINIPAEGSLEELGDYQKLTPTSQVGDQCIQDNLVRATIYLGYKTGLRAHKEMFIYWIAERKEWIGIYHENWLESMAWGDDDNYQGPYELDDSYAPMILMSYKKSSDILKTSKITASQILHMSPEELAELI